MASESKHTATAKSRHEKVLEIMFPAGQDEENGTTTSLQYDEEAKRYVRVDRLDNVPAEELVCPICLDEIGSSCGVSGPCGHKYHYDCLMNWTKLDHNDCPQCRQLLWDRQVYDAIQAKFPPDQPPPQETETPPRRIFPCWMPLVLVATIAFGILGKLYFMLHSDDPSWYSPPDDELPDYAVRAADIRDYINSITLTGRTLRYPSNETAEEKALAYLIDATKATVRTDSAKFQRITQEYVILVHLFQKYDSLPSNMMDDFGSLCVLQEFNVENVNVACTYTKQEEAGFTFYSGFVTNMTVPVPLSEEIGLLTFLEHIESISNDKAPLPGSFERLSNLKSFSANSLSGSLPEFVGALSNLVTFNVSNCSLTGTLPNSLSRWELLETFDVSNNELQGPFPEALENWSFMREFNVSANEFSGKLPDAVSLWSELTLFDVHSNQLSGTVPAINAPYIDLSGNAFTGNVSCMDVSSSSGSLIADCDKVLCECCTVCCDDSGTCSEP